MERLVALDVGGTNVKYGVFHGETLLSQGQFPLDEQAPAEALLRQLTDFVQPLAPDILAVSMPGPMDYDRGLCLMRHKFPHLYGISLKDALTRAMPGLRCSFVHDGAAFAMGEMACGALRGYREALVVTLGTGLGYVRCHEGRLLMLPRLTPAQPMWCMPYRSGTAEDYVSGRAIGRRWAALSGHAATARDAAEAARSGNESALALLEDVGCMLGELLALRCAGQAVERIVVGGQVANALDLLLPGIRRMCSVPVCRAEHPANAALYGARLYAREDREAWFTITEEEASAC